MDAEKKFMTYNDLDSHGYHGNLILRLIIRQESSLN